MYSLRHCCSMLIQQFPTSLQSMLIAIYSYKGRKNDHEGTSQSTCPVAYTLANSESDHPTQNNEEEAAANRTFDANQIHSYEEIPAGGIRRNNFSVVVQNSLYAE